MTENFQLTDLVYNRNTKEDGSVKRVYKTNGATMYEMAVPQKGDSWAAGYIRITEIPVSAAKDGFEKEKQCWLQVKADERWSSSFGKTKQ